jgi:hypothetical protein
LDQAKKIWRHKKRGTHYEIVSAGSISLSGTPLLDGDSVVIYRCKEDGRYWVRPTEEFHDGRFEESQ